LTPSSTWEDGKFRFADGVLDLSRNRIVCVREDHTNPAPAEVKNEVVSVSLDGSGAMEVLATGRDFYAHPRVSADGAKIAYVAWNHPNMPWDATELRVRPGDSSAAETDAHELVAGGDGDTSVIQPSWHPTSGSLWFVSDASGYYNLYRVAPEGGPPAHVLPR
jgi:Tol biopolymer transport system component